ncbi:MAG TPA: hypothetical protein VMU55_02965 [Solirubrobacteraceae bacterium]|nr:hypothetical protein [Solirubrobacteraceae bacterium]
MIDKDLQAIAGGPLDRSLETLETDIWIRLDLKRKARLLRRIVALQSVLAAVAFAASALAGFRAVPPTQAAHDLDVFSVRVALSSAALVGERQP